MLAGLALGQVVPALVASTGALIVGFGAFQSQFRHPTTPMIAVALGASLSAGIGTLANAWLPVELACAMLWGVVLGLTNLIGSGAGWLALQAAIALVIAVSFPATPTGALSRFILVLVGAALQFGIIGLLRALIGRPAVAVEPAQALAASTVLRQSVAILAGRRPGLGYALASGLGVTVADLLGHSTPMSNGYWIPMTLLLVLRPDRSETSTRMVLRLAGTLGGVVVLTLLMALWRPSPPMILLLIAIAAWSCYALLRVNYGLLSFGITSYVVLLFALAGLPEPMVALHRTVATVLGGIVALMAHSFCRRFGDAWPGAPHPGCA